MATKKFIKLYSILKDDIDSKGNINPNAALYPLFAEQYKDNTTGKRYADLPPEQIKEHLSDEDTPYDNSTNSHPNRTVDVIERSSNPTIDTNVIGQVGPNMKRGFSVLAYSNRDKRNGKDYFTNWYRHSHDKHNIDYFPDFENTPGYKKSYATPQNDTKTLSRLLSNFGNTSGRFYSIPLIVTAEDSDIINIDDVLNDNYDPLRDFSSEQQLKRIIKRSVIPNGQFKMEAVDSKSIALLNSVFSECRVSATNILNNMPDLENLDLQDVINLLKEFNLICDNFMAAAYMRNYSSQTRKRVDKALYALINGGIIPNTSAAIFQVSECIDNLYLALSRLESERMSAPNNVNKYLQKIPQLLSKLEHDLKRAVGIFTEATNTLTEFQNSNISIPINMSYDFSKILGKGGAFDWYDNTTSSDERIKNIIDTGKQVTLSDKQQKYILDDFNNFCDNYQKHNRLLKGIKELGQ